MLLIYLIVETDLITVRVIIIIIKLNVNAVKNNQQINHLNQLERLLPDATKKLSKAVIKAFKVRITKVEHLKSPLSSDFKVDGTVVIKDYYFDTVINALNHIINNQYNGHRYQQIKDSIRYLRTSVNHADKHVIATQAGKLLLLKLVKALKTSTHYDNLHQTVNNVVHIISQCFILNQEAYQDYHFLIRRFNRTH